MADPPGASRKRGSASAAQALAAKVPRLGGGDGDEGLSETAAALLAGFDSEIVVDEMEAFLAANPELAGLAESALPDVSGQDLDDQLAQALELANGEMAGEGAVDGACTAPPEDLAFGYVKQTLPQKGFSLLITDPSDESTTVYVHHTVCQPSILENSHAVAYKVHLNKKGQEQASAPVWLLLGMVKEGSTVSWGEFQGTVKSVVNPKGYAFVDCAAVMSQYGRDAYIHEKVVEKCMLREGDTIRFDIHVNAQGMPQVSAPIWKQHSDRDAERQQVPQSTVTVTDQFIGCVKTRHLEAGFTMISCPEVVSKKDVYMHKAIVPPDAVEQGEWVAFQIHWSAKGDPQASVPIWKLLAHDQWKPPQFGEFQGKIARVMANGSAFVQCEAVKAIHGKDAYVHHAVMQSGGMFEGDAIAFNVHVNSQGMPQVSSPTWKCISDTSGFEQNSWTPDWGMAKGCGMAKGSGGPKGCGAPKGCGGKGFGGGGKGCGSAAAIKGGCGGCGCGGAKGGGGKDDESWDSWGWAPQSMPEAMMWMMSQWMKGEGKAKGVKGKDKGKGKAGDGQSGAGAGGCGGCAYGGASGGGKGGKGGALHGGKQQFQPLKPGPVAAASTW